MISGLLSLLVVLLLSFWVALVGLLMSLRSFPPVVVKVVGVILLLLVLVVVRVASPMRLK